MRRWRLKHMIPRQTLALTPRGSWITMASMTAVSLTLAVVLTVTIASPLKDDIAWLLHVAQAALHGSRLYTDIIEVNPPMIIWISAIPVALADAIGTPVKILAVLFFAAAILAPAWWSTTILSGYSRVFKHRAAIFGAAAIVLLTVPGVELGQREHLLVALALPYLSLFARRLQGWQPGKTEATLVGVVAAVGCALKPRYAIPFGLLELVGTSRGLSLLRAEVVSGTTVLFGYTVLIILIYPTYFHTIVPLALALYGASDAPFVKILLESHTLLFGQLVVGVLLLRRAGPLFHDNLLLTLLVFGLGATLTCFGQEKDWFYHRLPATIVLWLSLIYWITAALSEPERADRRYRIALLAAACAVGALAQTTLARLEPRLELALHLDTSLETRLEHVVARERASTYMAFSQSLSAGFPVVNDTGVAWSSRFDSMWALRGVLWRQQQDGGNPDWPVRNWIVDDFIAQCPDLVAVDDRDGLNYVGILSAVPAFAVAWSAYRQVDAFGGMRVFRRSAIVEHHVIRMAVPSAASGSVSAPKSYGAAAAEPSSDRCARPDATVVRNARIKSAPPEASKTN